MREGGSTGGREYGREYGRVVRKGVAAMLSNCSAQVDAADAQCAVAADKERELATIGPENLDKINKIVRGGRGGGRGGGQQH